jgi:hypothetical protein
MGQEGLPESLTPWRTAMIPFAPANRRPRTLAPLVGPVVIVLCWSGPALETGRAQMTQPELRKFVREALEHDTFPVKKPVIRFDKDALRFDLGSVDLGEGFDHWWSFPLQDQFKVELIRKYRSSAEQQRRWEPELQRAEGVIDKELALIDRHEKETKKRPTADFDLKLEGLLGGYSEYIDRILVSVLDRAAEERDLIAVRIRREVPVEADLCTVKIETEPSGAAVYYLPQVAYEIKQRKGPAANMVKWERVGSDSIGLLGYYYFQVRWQDGTTTTNRYRITKDQTLLLRP